MKNEKDIESAVEEKSSVNLSLEKLVNSVNYEKYEKDYVPSEFAVKLINFIKLVGEDNEEHRSPVFHYAMLDNFIKYTYNLFVVFRGGSKSTLIEYIILYIAVFGRLDGFGDLRLALYVSDTMENGVKTLRNNLQFKWQNSAFLQKFIPKVKFTDARIEFINADGHEFILKLYGISTGIRGVRELGERPKLVFIDDILSDHNANSPTIMSMADEVLNKAIKYALHPTKRKILWVGTPFNAKDPLYKRAATKTWNTLVFPVCEKYPVEKKNFKGAWEERFTYTFVRDAYEAAKEEKAIAAFNQEMMLRILSNEDRLVLEEDIIWYKRNSVLSHLNDFHIYITTDFATSEKEGSDFSVIAVWALDSKGVFHWIDGVCARQDMAKNVDDLFRFTSMYDPLAVGIEISGQQKGFISWLKRDMTTRNKWFRIASDKASLEEGLRPTTSKLTRFNGVLPLFKQRKIAFPEELRNSTIMLEYVDELLSVTPNGIKSLHDDCIDTISQLQLMEYAIPSEATSIEQTSIYSESKYFKKPEENTDEFCYSYFP